MSKLKKVAILGSVGVPANYGGFETLAENLVKYHDATSSKISLSVFCSCCAYPSKDESYLSAKLKYVPLQANGVQSIPYDICSLLSAAWCRTDVILLLGVSGAIALPFLRLFSSVRIITNIDGLEWRRAKWKGLAKHFLRFSERIAVRFSHEIISDNRAIAEYVRRTYKVGSQVIAYGGDHAVTVDEAVVDEFDLPETFAFSICRIEPENNLHIILETFSNLDSPHLVMVGNWNNSEYGRGLRERYAAFKHLLLLDPIYDLGKLKTLRSKAVFYVHGHSAGGTNPSLVEAMHFGKPVLAFDCNYNRRTTEDKALFFRDSKALQQLIKSLDKTASKKVGLDMIEIAQRRYTWQKIASEYFALLDT
jgi:glycosyltransferase involved in cell wall biosynthesis